MSFCEMESVSVIGSPHILYRTRDDFKVCLLVFLENLVPKLILAALVQPRFCNGAPDCTTYMRPFFNCGLWCDGEHYI